MTHDECVEMRASLVALREEFLPQRLREVLEDLLYHHSSEADEHFDIEYVVRVLNVPGTPSDYEIIEQRWGPESAAESRAWDVVMVGHQEKMFARFDRDQARVIRDWLTYAREWPELKWYADDVDGALRYWTSRSEAK